MLFKSFPKKLVDGIEHYMFGNNSRNFLGEFYKSEQTVKVLGMLDYNTHDCLRHNNSKQAKYYLNTRPWKGITLFLKD